MTDKSDAALDARMKEITHRYLVLSGKGGVGKSTVAANLAVALAARGQSVGLLDIDVHGPSIPALMGVADEQLHSDGTEIQPVMAGQVKTVSVGFMLDTPDDAVIWRGPMKFNVITQFLRDVAWGHCDALVVDAPPGTGDEPLSIAQKVGRPASAVIVTTPQKIALNDVRRCISFCGKVALPVAGVVENMSGFVCPHCGASTDLFPGHGGEKLARETGVPFLGRIPCDPSIVLSGETGCPFSNHTESTATTDAFNSLVDTLLTTPPQEIT